jgi:nucleoid-associated protein YgaU
MSPNRRMIPDTQDQDTSTNVQAEPAQEEAQPPAATQQTPDMGTVEQIDAMMPKPETSSAADVVRRAMEEEARKQAEREAAFRQAAAAAAAKPKVTHVVVSGDTLSGIAAQYYSDGGRWPAIYEANKDVIGDNPNLILVGQELVIPEA